MVLLLAIQVCSCVRVSRQAPARNGETATAVTISGRSEGDQININKASARELQALPGVGEVLAERIIAHREQYGPFRRAEHLMMVRGFSDNKFRSIRVLITVD